MMPKAASGTAEPLLLANVNTTLALRRHVGLPTCRLPLTTTLATVHAKSASAMISELEGGMVIAPKVGGTPPKEQPLTSTLAPGGRVTSPLVGTVPFALREISYRQRKLYIVCLKIPSVYQHACVAPIDWITHVCTLQHNVFDAHQMEGSCHQVRLEAVKGQLVCPAAAARGRSGQPSVACAMLGSAPVLGLRVGLGRG